MLTIAPFSSGGEPVVVLNPLAFSETPEQAQHLRASLVDRLPPVLTPVVLDRPSSVESIFQQTSPMLVSKRYRTDNILTDRSREIAALIERNQAA